MDYRLIYRAWHKPTKRMFTVYGYNCDFVFEDSLDGILTSPTLPAKFEDCVLMQCIGRQDKNGKLIFEYDILKKETQKLYYEISPYWYNSVVIWDKDRWQLGRLKELSRGSVCPNRRIDRLEGLKKKLALVQYTPIKNFTGAEVIGNMFETPELLEAYCDRKNIEMRLGT